MTKEFDPYQILDIRRRLGPASRLLDPDVRPGLIQTGRNFNTDLLQTLKRERAAVVLFFERAKKVLPNSSRVELASGYADRIITPRITNEAMSSLSNRNTFLMYADLLVGFNHVTLLPYAVEEHLRGNSGTNFIEYSNEQGDNRNITDSTEHFLRINSDIEEGLSKLKEDTSGLSVVENVARKIREGTSIIAPNYYDPDFLILGADLAVDAYKFVYPLTA